MEEDPRIAAHAAAGGDPKIDVCDVAVVNSLDNSNHHATQEPVPVVITPVEPSALSDSLSTVPNTSVLELSESMPAQGDEVEHAANKVGPTLIVPEVGMSFESEKEAYEMYTTLTPVGFSIRKSFQKRRPKDGTISQKYIVCSGEGYCQNTESSKDATRTGCNARVQFSVSREGVWTVQKVVLNHNHYLSSPNKSHKLRSQRHVIEADRMLISQIREAGMKPSQVYEFMKQFYGGADKVPFSRMDCNNDTGRERNKYLKSNDAQTLLEYLKNKQMEDPTFFMLLS
ncbi:LOW QUALITY PROTEIN: hypothetical protein U9M48_003766 [Paspalum notatum var. saurae]|uniref:FAR1 domain-containing protein n=1 Tax=Paspalum notatum var. saurae TaxID=547442 RepID=A0AAQ3PM61_PASNO